MLRPRSLYSNTRAIYLKRVEKLVDEEIDYMFSLSRRLYE